MVQPNGVSLSSFWTNRLGGKVTDWQLQWLDRERAFWKFLPSLFLLGKAHPWSWSVSLRSMPRASPLPPLFLHQGRWSSLCHVCKLQREEQNIGLFSFFLLPLQPPKRMHSCKEQTQTHWSFWFLSFFFFFPLKPLQDGFTFCFGKLSGIPVGQQEELLLLAPENGQCSGCN